MPSQPVDLLIQARWVLPIAPVNTALADHAIAVSDGRIVAVGPIAEMNLRFSARDRIVRDEHALLPGLVNPFTQVAMTALRGLPVRGPRSQWLESIRPLEKRLMSSELARDTARLAIAEMLLAGITTFADHYVFPEAMARVAAAARIRAAVGLPVWDSESAGPDPGDGFAQAERLWDEYRSDPWVSLYFAPQNAAGLADATLIRVRRVADELDARVAMELHETPEAVQECVVRYGQRPLQRLRTLGLLRPGATGIHMNHLDSRDYGVITGTGMSVAACLQSDARLGAPACPVWQLDHQHVALGLGTADPASAGAIDVLAEARCAALLDHGNPPDALRLATLGGAAALGLSATTGSLEPGKAADLVCFDLRALACQTPAAADAGAAVAAAILFGATRGAITDVWTSGRAAVSAGQLLTFDESELRACARHWAARIQPELR